jgi:hypothetical protein
VNQFSKWESERVKKSVEGAKSKSLLLLLGN